MVDYRVPGYGEQVQWDYPPSDEDPYMEIPVPADLYTNPNLDPLAPPPASPPSGLSIKAKLGQTASGMFTGPNSFATMAIESARALPETVYNAIDYPAASLRGDVDPLSDEGIQRGADAAGTVTLGGGAVPRAAPKTALRSGLGRPGPTSTRPKLTPAIYGPDGNIYVGPNHGDISGRLPDKVAQHFWDNYNPNREGFVDQNGNFLNRKEAKIYAKKNDLLPEGDTLSGSDELGSEDLIPRAPWQRDLYDIGDDEGIYANRSVTGAIPLFSRMEREAAAIPQPRAQGQQWSATLKNKGVPQEEVEWTGVADWLKERGTLPVTKEELLSQIGKAQTQVGVTRRGEQINQAQTDNIQDVREWVRGYSGMDPERMNNQQIRQQAEADGYNEFQVQSGNTPPRATKFQQYQLPGGENYREVLLTLPHEKPKNLLAAAQDIARQAGEDWFSLGPETQKNYMRDAEALQPDKPFTSSHWDEPNVLAHMRVNDRFLPDAPEPAGFTVRNRASGNQGPRFATEQEALDYQKTLPPAMQSQTQVTPIPGRQPTTGTRVLFAEEIQSDWHQKGRREGYREKPPTELEDARQWMENTGEDVDLDTMTEAQVLDLARKNGWTYGRSAEGFGTGFQGVPNAPFKKSWPDLVLKRLVADAIEGGYDAIAWTDGATQAARYKLSDHVDSIDVTPVNSDPNGNLKWRPNTKNKEFGSITTDRSGKILRANPNFGDVEGKNIVEVFGKGVADQGLKADTVEITIQGTDLDLGGEGMKAFYDQELPRRAKKLFGRWGAVVEDQTFNEEATMAPNQMRSSMKYPAAKEHNIHILRITPEMRAAIQTEGLPLYANKSKAAGAVAMAGEKPEGIQGVPNTKAELFRYLEGGLSDNQIPLVATENNPLVALTPMRSEAFDRKSTPIVEIPVADIQTWQGTIDHDKIKPLTEDYPPIHVGRINGQLVVMNGNHRLTSAIQGGLSTIRAKYVDFNAPENKKYWSKKKRPITGGRFAAGGGVQIEVNGRTYTGPKKSLQGRRLSTNIEDRRASEKDKVNVKKKGDRLPTALESLVNPESIGLTPPQPYSDGDEMRTDSTITEGIPQSIEDIILRQGGDQFTDGLVHDPTPGRTDRLPTSMPADSYVIPADIVSGMGQGNTLAGAKILDAIFHAHGGGVKGKAGGGSIGKRIPVIVAGGEYVVSPGKVRSLGGGDPTKGHKLLDSFTKRNRLNLVKRLKSLDGPRTD